VYLSALSKSKVYMARLGFGAGKVGLPELIVYVIYGRKLSGARWQDHMAVRLR
jgi:hypothetical protein